MDQYNSGSIQNPFTEMTQIPLQLTSGYYYFKLTDELPLIQIYLDNQTDGGGWLRMNIKQNQIYRPTFLNPEITIQFLKALGIIKSIAFSDNESTINCEYSWILNDVKITGSIVTSSPSVYPAILDSSCLDEQKMLSYFINCKTPTNTVWSQDYDRSYLFFSSEKLETKGGWDEMYVTEGSTTKVGQPISIRSGGACAHTGEYIHTSCNGYNKIQHSITSLISWNDTRVFWIKV